MSLLIVGTGRKKKIDNKVANIFYSEVLKLVNLTNRRGGKNQIITTSLLCKRKLQQDQKKITKTNKSQIKRKQNKPKLKGKEPVKTLKQKSLC